MAPVGHAPIHGAGLQCRHLLGKAVFSVRPGSAWMRGFESGLSNTDQKRFLLVEWTTAQAISHCLQPTHRSGFIKTVFIRLHPFQAGTLGGLLPVPENGTLSGCLSARHLLSSPVTEPES